MATNRKKTPANRTSEAAKALDFYNRSFAGLDLHFAEYGFRVKSFRMDMEWPFLEDCSCTPEKLAEAGFYFVGTSKEPDLVRCYWCRRELDGWEPTDDPWSEHARRECPFVKLGKKPDQLTYNDLVNLEVEKMNCLMQVVKTKKEAEIQERVEAVRNDIARAKKAGGGGRKKKY